LAQETRHRIAVPEQPGEGAPAGRGEQRHADVAGHPDGEVGHEPPGTVAREDHDARAGRPVLRLQPRRHLPYLADCTGPGPRGYMAVDWLREQQFRGTVLLASVDPLQG